MSTSDSFTWLSQQIPHCIRSTRRNSQKGVSSWRGCEFRGVACAARKTSVQTHKLSWQPAKNKLWERAHIWSSLFDHPRGCHFGQGHGARNEDIRARGQSDDLVDRVRKAGWQTHTSHQCVSRMQQLVSSLWPNRPQDGSSGGARPRHHVNSFHCSLHQPTLEGSLWTPIPCDLHRSTPDRSGIAGRCLADMGGTVEMCCSSRKAPVLHKGDRCASVQFFIQTQWTLFKKPFLCAFFSRETEVTT